MKPSKAGNREELRNRVYETMVTRAKNNTVELIQYIKAEEKDD